MFVRINVPVGTNPEAILVHDRAINTDIGGKYLLLVNAEGLVQRQPVELGRSLGEMRVIASGLSTNDTYILRGVQTARPGMKVVTQTEDENATMSSQSMQNPTVQDRPQE